MLIGYARTSTEDQVAGLDAQIKDLDVARCDTVHAEHISSVAEHRPVFEFVMNLLSKGDTLVVTKLDRLARSTLGLWQIVKRLEDKGAGLRILNFGGETVDTKSATGKLILTIFAGFAQFEREMMLERQSVGIAKAKAENKYHGRKSRIAQKDAIQAVKMHDDGMTIREISAQLNIPRSTVFRVVGREAA